jgi:hypothetical protein
MRNYVKTLPKELSAIQHEIVLGSLLGDASLSKLLTDKCNSMFSESHTDPQYEYLLWKYEALKPFLVDKITSYKISKIIHVDGLIKADKNDRRNVHSINSYAHPTFTALEREWYLRDEEGHYILNAKSKRVKKVPENLKLTPLMVAVWFCDDGSQHKSTKSVRFATQGYRREDSKILVCKLKEIGINSYVQNFANEIRLYTESFLPFINLIKPFVPKCMSYKVDLTDYVPSILMFGETHPRAKLKERDVLDIKRRLDLGESQITISKLYHVSRNAIGKIKNGQSWKHLCLSTSQ